MIKLKLLGYLLLAGVLLGACSSAGSGPKGVGKATAQPTDREVVALEWSREGGIAGFCDRLVIMVTGEAVATNCQKETLVEVGRTNLETAQLSWISEKLKKLEAFEWEQSDAATADAMTVKIHFFGKGNAEASQKEQQELLDLAGSVFSTVK